MDKKMSLRQKCSVNLAKRVILFKRTLRQWFYYAGLKYLQTHSLTDAQEVFLEDITEFFIKAIDKIETDEEFLKSTELQPVSIKKKVR